MQRVMLIGDSIRRGYEAIVRKELANEAEVGGPDANCGNSVQILVGIAPWLLRRDADVVHLNCGLHDLKTIVFGGRENVVPVDHYRRNVHAILSVLLAHTKAKSVWATTTPINEANDHRTHAEPRDFDRYEADVVAYNEAAVDVCKRLGVPIDDLYAVVMNAGKDGLLKEDGVHYTPEGYHTLGRAVAAAIRKQLAASR